MKYFILAILISSNYLIAASDSIQTKEIKGTLQVHRVEPDDYHYGLSLEKSPFNFPTNTKKRNSLEITVSNQTQNYRLNELKLVGIWGIDGENPHALIELPNSKSEVLKPGDFIGSGGSKIVKITEDYIRVRKISLTPDGTQNFEDQEIGFIKDFTKQEPKKEIKIEAPSMAPTLNSKISEEQMPSPVAEINDLKETVKSSIEKLTPILEANKNPQASSSQMSKRN